MQNPLVGDASASPKFSLPAPSAVKPEASVLLASRVVQSYKVTLSSLVNHGAGIIHRRSMIYHLLTGSRIANATRFPFL